MKKNIILGLLLWLGAISTNAQVVIAPQETTLDPVRAGAVLDLQNGEQKLGLKFPNVSLRNVAEFQLNGIADTDIKALSSANGMVVYNTNELITTGRGLYAWVWNNAAGKGKWMPYMVVGTPNFAKPGIITSDPAEICPNTAGVIFSVAGVSGATSYTWEVPEDWEITSIDQTTKSIEVTVGDIADVIKVKANYPKGSSDFRTLTAKIIAVPVKPTEQNGSAFSCPLGTQTYSVRQVKGITYHWDVPVEYWRIINGGNETDNFVTVEDINNNPLGVPITVTPYNSCGVAGESLTWTVSRKGDKYTQTIDKIYTAANPAGYEVYTYPKCWGTWMVNNSKEGTPSITYSTGTYNNETAYYYTNALVYANPTAVCPNGFTPPSRKNFEFLYPPDRDQPDRYQEILSQFTWLELSFWDGGTARSARNPLNGNIYMSSGKPGTFDSPGNSNTYAVYGANTSILSNNYITIDKGELLGTLWSGLSGSATNVARSLRCVKY